jgi:tetratricopeptide (TPR) repeat protein
MRGPNACRAVLLSALLPLSTLSSAHITGVAPEQLGKVSFANSCQPAVQPTFERGVALLHSFWFREAEKAFREALARDPDCAIAGWGIATTLIGNTFAVGPTPAQAQQAKEAIERARATGRKTERERNFIEAIAQYYDNYPGRPHMQRMKALSDAFELVAKRFPEDDEAQIFSAVYLTATQPLTDQTYAAALKAAAILEVQFKKHPDHPGVAHYLIHSYDFPSIAEKGMSAARRYSEIAPSAPHALHMPSHIFTRVGAWKESAEMNERSAAAAKQTNEPNDGLHAMDYSVYAYLQLGQDANARRVLKEAREVKNFVPTIRSGPYALAAMPARIALERSDWQEASKLEPQESNFPYTKSQTHFARAIGAARGGNPAAAEPDVKELEKIVEGLKGKDVYWATEVEVQRLTGSGWVEFANGNRDKSIALMRSAADMEDANEKSSLTPARMLPARELLGDMLLAAGKPAEALAEYEKSQIREPNRYRGLYGAGQAAAQAGNREKARYYFGKLVEMAGDGVRSSEIQAVRQHIARN